MDINLNVTFKCEGLIDLIREANAPGRSVAKATSAAPADAMTPTKKAEAPAPAAEVSEDPPKKVAKKKAKEPEAETSDEELPATMENCRKLIRAYACMDGAEGEKGGLKKAHGIVTSFGVNKLVELPEEKFADFIKAVQSKMTAEKSVDDL